MAKISAAEARKDFAEIINRAAYGKERIVIMRRGKKLAAVVSIEDLEGLEQLGNKVDAEEIKKAWKQQGKKPPKSWKQLKKKLGL